MTPIGKHPILSVAEWVQLPVLSFPLLSDDSGG
jgi:hypothetical protein